MNPSGNSIEILGYGKWQYKPVRDWPQLPDDSGFVEAIGVAVGPNDRVFVFNRGNPAVLAFEPDGRFVQAWGEDCFVRPHGILAASDGTLYLTDDLGHRVAQFTEDGNLLRNIGPAGVASDTGVSGFDFRKHAIELVCYALLFFNLVAHSFEQLRNVFPTGA